LSGYRNGTRHYWRLSKKRTAFGVFVGAVPTIPRVPSAKSASIVLTGGLIINNSEVQSMQKYSKEQFLEICVKSEYAERAVAEKYAANRQEFTVDDFVAVSEQKEEKNEV
jgi:hypothetical protein